MKRDLRAEGWILCEGCETVAVESPEAVGTEAFARTYPLCPGKPTRKGCHGFFAGCNCPDCVARDVERKELLV